MKSQHRRNKLRKGKAPLGILTFKPISNEKLEEFKELWQKQMSLGAFSRPIISSSPPTFQKFNSPKRARFLLYCKNR